MALPSMDPPTQKHFGPGLALLAKQPMTGTQSFYMTNWPIVGFSVNSHGPPLCMANAWQFQPRAIRPDLTIVIIFNLARQNFMTILSWASGQMAIT